MSSARPLVSVGIPTYNRLAKLQQSLPRVLAQTYSPLEIVVSDNASVDGTEAWCRELAARDARVRYLRQPRNIGPTANYVAVLEAARGELYSALADDDWVDERWVERCAEELLGDPSLVLVTGRARMHESGQFVRDGVKMDLLDESPADRVVRYYEEVVENTVFHGVVRRDRVLALPRLPNTMGGDWLFMASIAFTGRMKTIESTRIVKHAGGASRTFDHIADVLGLSPLQKRFALESIAVSAVADIGWRSPVYRSL
ncbi:MAG TPA: glycosyltransferase family 2 protein, partial [Polyangia bacterium]